jgi:hypothetical protein
LKIANQSISLSVSLGQTIKVLPLACHFYHWQLQSRKGAIQ